MDFMQPTQSQRARVRWRTTVPKDAVIITLHGSGPFKRAKIPMGDNERSGFWVTTKIGSQVRIPRVYLEEIKQGN